MTSKRHRLFSACWCCQSWPFHRFQVSSTRLASFPPIVMSAPASLLAVCYHPTVLIPRWNVAASLASMPFGSRHLTVLIPWSTATPSLLSYPPLSSNRTDLRSCLDYYLICNLLLHCGHIMQAIWLFSSMASLNLHAAVSIRVTSGTVDDGRQRPARWFSYMPSASSPTTPTTKRRRTSMSPGPSGNDHRMYP